jgi:hypothetical protein
MMSVATPRVSVTVASSRACPDALITIVDNQTVIANTKSPWVKSLSEEKKNGINYLNTCLINCERWGRQNAPGNP